MTNLEEEIKKAFGQENIDLTSKEILEKSNISFISKRQKFTFAQGLLISSVSLALAGGVFCVALIPQFNYVESIEDSVSNRSFASHVLSCLGASDLFLKSPDIENINVLPGNIQKETLPPIAFLNYTYTNKNHLDYSFLEEKTNIESETFNVKENIRDEFLSKNYDLFLKKENDYKIKALVINNEAQTKTPTYRLDILGNERNKDCYLKLNFKPLSEKHKDYLFSLEEKVDKSIQYSLDISEEPIFTCLFEFHDNYNKFTLDLHKFNKRFIFKISNFGNLNYGCEYSEEDNQESTTSYDYTFTDDGTIEEN